MRIEIRGDSVELDGYVNAVERDSRPIVTAMGKCIERISQGAFKEALGRSNNVDLLLNHDKGRKLGSTLDGNLELFEDNIGLRAICTVTDQEIVDKARNGKLKGWSFGMIATGAEKEERAAGLPPRRIIKSLELLEVSIIDDRMVPCYTATTIEERAGTEVESEIRSAEFIAKMVETPYIKKLDYKQYEERINKIKANN